MMKCPGCGRDSSTYRIEVLACHECHRVLYAEDLYRKLKELKVSENTIERIEQDFRSRNPKLWKQQPYRET